MRNLWPALLLLGRLAAAQAPGPKDQVFTLPNPKDCGVITRLSPNLIENISPGCLQVANNFYFDEDWSLSRRNGYALYNANPCTGLGAVKGLWPFNATDGTKYLVIFSSNTMYSSKGDGTCTAITGLSGAISSGVEMQCVQAQGQLFCGDGTDSPFYTNVTSTAILVGAPIGPLMGSFRNRILIGGVSGNLTQLYLSGELNPYDWTLPAVQSSTSPAVIGVNGVNDGMKINCLMGEFQNQYLIGRDYDLFALSGYDLRDFTLRRVSNQIGCIEPKSVQEVNNALIWISKRGVEQFTGTQINPISYVIRPSIDQIISAAGNSRSQLFTSQADFNSGTLCASGPNSCVSTTISPGDVVPSSFSVTENTTTQFAFGTLSNISTSPVSNALTMFQGSKTAFPNAGGELNSTSTNWPTQGGFNIVSAFAMLGSESWTGALDNTSCASGQVTFSVLDTSENVLVTKTFTVTKNLGQTNQTINIGSNSQEMVKLNVTTINNGSGCSNPTKITSESVPFINGNSVQVAYEDNGLNSGGGNNFFRIMWDVDESGMATSGAYTQQAYDTSLATPTWGNLNGTVVLGDATDAITFQTKVKTTSAGSFDAPVAVANGTKILSAQKEFISGIANFSVGTTTDTPPHLTGLTLNAATTAYYITPCVLVSSPTSWGSFNVDGVTNGGAFTFWTSTGPTCAAATAINAPWIVQPANAQIVVSTATTYVAARVLFGLGSSTDTPTLNDVTFNWNTASNRPPTSSIQYKDRYYLFYTTNTVGTPVNDHAVVYDFNGKWTFFDDVNAYSATIYLNKPYIGDSNSTGNIYQFDSGLSDNGNAFTSSFQTADLDFGVPAQLKRFRRMYLFVNGPPGPSSAISVSCNYFIDGSTTSYSLSNYSLTSAPEQTGYGVAKFSFPAGNTSTAHWLNMSCNYSGSDGPLKIYGLQLVWAPINWE